MEPIKLTAKLAPTCRKSWYRRRFIDYSGNISSEISSVYGCEPFENGIQRWQVIWLFDVAVQHTWWNIRTYLHIPVKEWWQIWETDHRLSAGGWCGVITLNAMWDHAHKETVPQSLQSFIFCRKFIAGGNQDFHWRAHYLPSVMEDVLMDVAGSLWKGTDYSRSTPVCCGRRKYVPARPSRNSQKYGCEPFENGIIRQFIAEEHCSDYNAYSGFYQSVTRWPDKGRDSSKYAHKHGIYHKSRILIGRIWLTLTESLKLVVFMRKSVQTFPLNY